MKSSLAAIALLLSTTTLSAQRAAVVIPKLGETLEVSIINVDVFVTDREGKRVHGLTKDDFVLLENGKPRPISNFAEYATETAATQAANSTTSTTATAAPRQPRTVVVFIDQHAVRSDVQGPIFDNIKQFLRGVLSEGDRASVVTWDTSMHVRQELTADLAKLEHAVDLAAAETSSLQPDVADRLMTQARYHDAPGRAPSPPVITGHADALRRLGDIKGKTAALESIITSLAGMEGRKLVLFATRNYQYDPNAGLLRANASMSTDVVRQSLIKTANAHGVTIYPLLPFGRIDRKVATPTFLNSTRALTEIAERTGGAMAYGAADIPALLPQIREDLGSYYSLAYRDENQGSDRARSIEVRVNKPGYRVRHRSQAVEKSYATRMKDRVRSQLFIPPAEPPTLAITAEVGAITKRGKNHSLVPILIRVPVRGLTFVPEGDMHSGAFSVFVVAGNSLGSEGDVTQQTRSFSFTNDELARARSSSLGYSVQLEIDATVDRISVGVLDEVSREQGLTTIKLPS